MLTTSWTTSCGTTRPEVIASRTERCARCADKRRELAATTDVKKLFQVQARRIMETAAKKIKIVKPGDNVMVPVPDLDREKINAHLLILVTLHSDDIEDRCLV